MADEYVYWHEENRPGRQVKRACNRCYGNAVSVHEITFEIVSRYGTAHKAAEYGETVCGIDATRANVVVGAVTGADFPGTLALLLTLAGLVLGRDLAWLLHVLRRP